VTAAAPRRYAGLVSRALAYLIDTLIIAVVFSVGAVVIGLITSVISARAFELVRAVASAYLLVLPAVLALYCALFWSLAGRTPGMALVGVRVVTVRGRPVSWPAALIRAVLLAYLPLLALWAVVDRRHQGLHDKITRTAVIATAEMRAPTPTPASRPAGTTQLGAG
jgi:uncharacterized RDD family membrane protein YckC